MHVTLHIVPVTLSIPVSSSKQLFITVKDETEKLNCHTTFLNSASNLKEA